MAAQPSLTRIVNRAAVWLGSAKRISAIDEDHPIANAARDTIDFVRDELLAAHPWNFALRRSLLAELADPPELLGRRAAFELPSDCLRWLPYPIGHAQYHPAEQEGAFLISNAAGPLPCRYIARVEDLALWSPGFTAAMSAQLAFEIAGVVTGADSLDAKLTRRLERAISEAKRQDGMATGARERVQAPVSDWLAARGDGSGGWYGDRDSQYGTPIV